MSTKSFLVLTEKGLALLSALQSGLVQSGDTDGMDRFFSFWDLFEKKRDEQMLNQQSNSTSKNSGKDRRPVLALISSLFCGSVLFALFEALGLGGLLLGLLAELYGFILAKLPE